MPNGKEFDANLQFEKAIKHFSPESKFLATQIREVCQKIEGIEGRVKLNTTRSYINRWVLIILIIVLITLGVIDSRLLAFLPVV
uniref:Uncharacterized protein n=1 Tax=viral metagenome TaxID=1070528 RepID=A0A6M3L9X1_9ZZZZ